VQFHQGASDCESQSQAAVAARDGGIGLAEALEHFRDKLRRDSFAAILNSDLELGFVGCASQADCAAVRRELDRVAQEIVENLFQPIFEPSTLPDSASSALSSRRFSRAAGIAAWTAHCATRIKQSMLDLDFAADETRNIEQVFDQPGLPRHGAVNRFQGLLQLWAVNSRRMIYTRPTIPWSGERSS
jgi:hypothetical protein